MLKVYEEYWQVYTMDDQVYDLPSKIKKEDFLSSIQEAKFIDLGDTIIAVHQIRKIKKMQNDDGVNIAISRLEEPLKSEAKQWKVIREKEGLRVNMITFQNFLDSKTDKGKN